MRSETTADLRTVFGAFPTGVAAVCGRDGDEPVGMTVSTFTPVSLDPPLLSLCVQRTSATWPRLRQAAALGVSILGEHHGPAGLQLSSTTGDRFAGLETRTAGSGSVFLSDPCAWFDCTLEAEHPAGDHVIALLRIDGCGRSASVAPLVVHGSRFRRLDALPSRTQER